MKIKENEKIDKYLDLAKELKKSMEHEGDSEPVVIGELETFPKGLERGLEKLEIKGIAETTQTKALWRSAKILRRGPEDLRRLAVTQIPVEVNQLTLAWKTRKEYYNLFKISEFHKDIVKFITRAMKTRKAEQGTEGYTQAPSREIHYDPKCLLYQ